jgi:hypothetical protein
MLPPWFVLVAAVFNVAGMWAYGRDTLAGRTQPNRVTWGLWGLAPMIAFAGQLSEGVGITALMTFMNGICPIIIVALSFADPGAYWALRRRDLICLGMSVAALAGWAITRHGVVAIALAITADFSAGLPTIVKAWRHPSTETATTFACSATAAAITLASAPNWDFQTVAFPLLIFWVSGTIFVLVRFPTLGPGRQEPVLTAEPI